MLIAIATAIHPWSWRITAVWKRLAFVPWIKLSLYFIQDFSEEKPLAWSHFTAEGDVEFKAVLFVPPKAPHDLYESYYNSNKSNLKLYVRRVFISDEFDELLPKYLSFLKVSIEISIGVCYLFRLVFWWSRICMLIKPT